MDEISKSEKSDEISKLEKSDVISKSDKPNETSPAIADQPKPAQNNVENDSKIKAPSDKKNTAETEDNCENPPPPSDKQVKDSKSNGNAEKVDDKNQTDNVTKKGEECPTKPQSNQTPSAEPVKT